MTNDEKLEKLHKELDEYKQTLSEIRRRILEEVEDKDLPFHQDVLIKAQHAAWDIEREILQLTPTEV